MKKKHLITIIDDAVIMAHSAPARPRTHQDQLTKSSCAALCQSSHRQQDSRIWSKQSALINLANSGAQTFPQTFPQLSSKLSSEESWGSM